MGPIAFAEFRRRHSEESMSCEHGLSLALCAGPEHYPADTEEHYSTGELMSATSAQYHREGQNCPWDCGSCPGNIEGFEEEDTVPPLTHQVQTCYGLLYATSLEEAKAKAREAAIATGRRAVITTYDPWEK